MKLKFLSGAVAPAFCAALAVAMSQQAGAKEPDIQRGDKPVSQQQSTGKPILTAEQQKLADQMTQDILNGRTPTNPNLTPEQRQKIEQMTQDIKNGKSPLTPEQQAKANQMTQDILNGKSVLTPEQQKKAQEIMNGKSPLTPEQQRQADKITQDLLNDKSKGGLGKLLTGDERTACEVILCLSSGTRPSECNPPIRKFLSIKARKWHQTVTKRKNFLKLCPNENNDSSINSAIERIANSNPVDCSAAALNQRFYWRGNRDADGYWQNSGIKLVPTTLAKQCGANWQAMVEYKCEEKQVPIWTEDSNGHSVQVRELVIDANGNRKWQTKMQTIQINCRFVDRKGYNGSYYF